MKPSTNHIGIPDVKSGSQSFYLSILLLILVVSIYIKALGYDFITFDTLVYVTENARVQGGITLDNLKWSFVTSFFSNWHPLTWISYMLDMELWGLNPVGFHATNIFLHACNSLLLFLTLKRMTSATFRSWFVACLFALHPMHVESVAWIAERKDVLSTFFFLLTVISYLSYIQRQTLSRYSLVLISFVMALMSKGMVVTLPAVLLLLDFWPLCRFDFENSTTRKREFVFNFEAATKHSILFEKIPLFLLSVFGAWMTIIAQQSNLTPIEDISLTERVSTAFVAYTAYLEKTILPINLSPLYPYSGPPSIYATTSAMLIFFSLTFTAILKRYHFPWFFVGWFWFSGCLIPVIGIVHVGHHFIADRYTYIPHIGLFIMFSWGFHYVINRLLRKQHLFPVFCFFIITIFGIITFKQLNYWKNDKTLWSRALKVTKNNYFAENNFGNALFLENMQLAKSYFIRSIAINDKYADAHSNLGLVLFQEGNLEEAIVHFKKAISLEPYSYLSHFRLALAYRKFNKLNEAIIHFQNAINIQPTFINAYYQLAEVLVENKRYEDALNIYSYIKSTIKDHKEINIIINNIKELKRIADAKKQQNLSRIKTNEKNTTEQ